MPTYTFTIEGDELAHERTHTELCENDEVAVHAARRALGPGHAAVSVGRGTGDGIEWLGAWDWEAGRARWTDEE